MSKRVYSQYQIERYLAGEMGEAEKAAFLRDCEQDPVLNTYVKKQAEISLNDPFEEIISRNHGGVLKEKARSGVSWAEGLLTWWENKRIPAVSIGLAVLVLSVVGVWYSRLEKLHPVDMTAKGDVGVQLVIQGKTVPPGSEVTALPGDTLSFRYRSNVKLFVQVWYRDDGGNWFAYLEQAGMPVVFPESPQRKLWHQSIVLTYGWEREELVLFVAEESFSSQQVKKALESGASLPGIQQKYLLLNGGAS